MWGIGLSTGHFNFRLNRFVIQSFYIFTETPLVKIYHIHITQILKIYTEVFCNLTKTELSTAGNRIHWISIISLLVFDNFSFAACFKRDLAFCSPRVPSEGEWRVHMGAGEGAVGAITMGNTRWEGVAAGEGAAVTAGTMLIMRESVTLTTETVWTPVIHAKMMTGVSFISAIF